MLETWLDIIMDTLLDCIKLVPFLFVTYIAMEYLEHKTGTRTQSMVKRAGKWGPLLGGVAGALPQCGFSAAASNLYAARVISLGTLFSIYLSTSDEMLPIFLSEQAPVSLICRVLAVKVAVGVLAGFVIDLILRKRQTQEEHIHDLCEKDHCHCEEGILRSAVQHTLRITLFILLITFALNALLAFAGEAFLTRLLMDRPLLGPLLACLVGLIPNCAASVVITQLYLGHMISFGTMIGGLLTGSGVGLLVLFRVNRDRGENLRIGGLLYLIGVCCGAAFNLIAQ